MLTHKQLVNPPFRINPAFYVDNNIITRENFSKKMKELANNHTRIQQVSRFFLPTVMNVFSDASISSEIRNKASIANVVTYTDNEMTTSYLSSSGFIDEFNTNQAETASVYFALICANDNNRVGHVSKINVFTDSITTIKKVRPVIRTINAYKNDANLLNAYLRSLNSDDTISEMIFMIANEVAEAKAPVNLFHLKGHTRNLMLIATKFLQTNGLEISVQDAIELTTYHSMVDSKVNKYICCPSTTFNA